MKILVIGASGLTGGYLLNHLLKDGHEITAFVREPGKFAAAHAGLKVAQGEARDMASLERATKGQDAVMSAFGPRSLQRDDLQEVFMRHLITAMTKNGVKRLVNLSAMGTGDSRRGAPLLMRAVILPLFLGKMFADKEKGEVHLLGSTLDYVNVRPGRLTNGPARGGVKASLEYRGLKPLMSREDLALFMIAQLKGSEWVRKSPLIGY
ncbi:MAG: NAD(P)-dependent oxidoreductase [Bdellovibrionota bacterium]